MARKIEVECYSKIVAKDYGNCDTCKEYCSRLTCHKCTYQFQNYHFDWRRYYDKNKKSIDEWLATY